MGDKHTHTHTHTHTHRESLECFATYITRPWQISAAHAHVCVCVCVTRVTLCVHTHTFMTPCLTKAVKGPSRHTRTGYHPSVHSIVSPICSAAPEPGARPVAPPGPSDGAVVSAVCVTGAVVGGVGCREETMSTRGEAVGTSPRMMLERGEWSPSTTSRLYLRMGKHITRVFTDRMATAAHVCDADTRLKHPRLCMWWNWSATAQICMYGGMLPFTLFPVSQLVCIVQRYIVSPWPLTCASVC